MSSELTYLKGVYQGVLKRNVKHWKEQIEIANASSDFQALRRKIDSMQRGVEKLINENNIDALLALNSPKTSYRTGWKYSYPDIFIASTGAESGTRHSQIGWLHVRVLRMIRTVRFDYFRQHVFHGIHHSCGAPF